MFSVATSFTQNSKHFCSADPPFLCFQLTVFICTTLAFLNPIGLQLFSLPLLQSLYHRWMSDTIVFFEIVPVSFTNLTLCPQ